MKAFPDTQGRPTKDARLVIGAVIIKHKLCLSDRETVLPRSRRTPILQYFVGLTGLSNGSAVCALPVRRDPQANGAGMCLMTFHECGYRRRWKNAKATIKPEVEKQPQSANARPSVEDIDGR